MKVFHCDSCRSLVFFESVECVRCGRVLGFLPDAMDVSTLEATPDGHWRALSSAAKGRLYRLCGNSKQHQVCNWLVSARDPNPFCVACRLNDMIPDLTVPGNLERWRKLEAAKRRTLYTLFRLGLPMEGVRTDRRTALRFRFLGKPASGPPPLTGHSQGEITVNIAEADDEERERVRVHLHEPYRTLLGHLRHEIAHYYWDQLISWTPRLTRFRELFGNEESDYEAALSRFYAQGPPADWQDRHISAYASAHPWEDWAETWAHYLHIVDTVETATGFGITLNPKHPAANAMTADPKKAAHLDTPFAEVLEQWLPLTCALNSLNRGMGLPDLYPFLLSAPAIEKLKFVHEVVQEARIQNGG
ncbi:MAG: hypothetical protein JWR26_2775 [Pedosphaera sp.]|nr:hypothetical protein [Pedosphaera sp.]